MPPETSDTLARGLVFPGPYAHDHPPIQDVHEVYQGSRSFGQKVADNVAAVIGSWPFIIGQTCVLAAWVVLNVTAMVRAWDPYPFILMNLVLSLQAAYAAPIIMMSQNRLSERDRLVAQNDYRVNLKAENEVRVLMDHLVAQDSALNEIYTKLSRIEQRLARSTEGEQVATLRS